MQRYFELMQQLQTAISKKDYAVAREAVIESLKCIPCFVSSTRVEYGRFDIRSIPALEQGGTVLAALGDAETLAAMQQLVESIADLASWRNEIDRHFADLELVHEILRVVAASPGIKQTAIKGVLGLPDGHRIGVMCAYLDKAGRLKRWRAGNSWELSLPKE